MGLFDVLTGRRKLAPPAPDRLFAITTAYVTMQTQLDLSSSGGAAVVFQSLATADFRSIVREMTELVTASAADSATTVRSSQDDYGFSWMVLEGDDFDALVVGINAVATAIEGGGYGERLLCAVFAFSDESVRGARGVYLIYNFKRGAFSPFVPTGEGQRDNERELRLRAQLGSELPVEAELTRWFALWGIPL